MQRSEDPLDRRNRRMTLTEAGQQVVQESVAARQSWLDRLPALLSETEQEQVATALRILIERAETLDEKNEQV